MAVKCLITKLSLYLAVVSAQCSIHPDVVHDIVISNELPGWKVCYDQPYSHGTQPSDLSSCYKGSEYWVFVGAKQTSSSATAYMGAYAPSSVLTKTTSGMTVSYNPNPVDPYYVYWYNDPLRAFGFSDTSKINLNAPDITDPTSNSKLSWYLGYGNGGWRAGSYNSFNGEDLNRNSIWRKIIYYKYCPTPIVLTTALIYAFEIKQQLQISSAAHNTSYGTKSTIRYDIEQIQDDITTNNAQIQTDMDQIIDDITHIKTDMDHIKTDIFDVKVLLALKANETMDELKDYLDVLHSRVQLRPTAAPTLSPTEPTTGPTISTADPTESPTPNPTAYPTTAQPTLSPTQTWAGEFTLSNGANDISSEDEIRFNDIWWSDENEYDIIKRVCPSCSNDYQEIYYRVINVSNVDDYNPYQLMTNWIQSADHEHEIHWNFDLYSTPANALKRQSNWYDCKEHIADEHGSISAFGDCTKKRNKYQSCQYSSADPGCNKEVTFSIFIGEPEYYGVDINDVSAARSNNLRSMLLDEDQDFEWEKYEPESEPNVNEDPKGMDYYGDGNIYIMITAKEFDVGMILTMFIIIIGFNIMILKYGCCGFEKESRYKYGIVKSIDTEYESEVVAPIKH